MRNIDIKQNDEMIYHITLTVPMDLSLWDCLYKQDKREDKDCRVPSLR